MTHSFEKHTLIKTTINRMIAFHQDPLALKLLTPPPIFVQLHRDERTSLTEGELEFTLWFGLIPIRWTALHQPGPTPTSFTDEMVHGPMAFWRHEHIFEVIPDGVMLTDRITIAHHPGWRGLITRLMFDGIPLQILFMYRHWRTRRAVS